MGLRVREAVGDTGRADYPGACIQQGLWATYVPLTASVTLLPIGGATVDLREGTTTYVHQER
jgi:hypothetical protein